MALLHITMPASGEGPERIKLASEVAEAIEMFLRRGLAEGRIAPCDPAMYAQMLALLGHAVLYQCFAVEGGIREELYQRTMLEMVERLLAISSSSSQEERQKSTPPTGEDL
jgi:hypothetical protein